MTEPGASEPVAGQPPPAYGQSGYPGYPAGYPDYPPPGQYGAVPPGGVRNGMGTAALVLGICALVLCWTIIGGLVFGVLGLVFGIIGRRRVARGEATNRGSATAGLTTAVIGLALTVILIVVGSVFFVHHKKDFTNLRDCLDQANTQVQRDQCNQDFRNAVTG